MSICPFCEHDPFHYVDNGVGMEAVAVTCCDLGDQFFRGMRPAPESIELSWDEFIDIGGKLANSRAAIEALVEALEKISAIENQEFGGDWDEIELARGIARSALLLARGSAGNE